MAAVVHPSDNQNDLVTGCSLQRTFFDDAIKAHETIQDRCAIGDDAKEIGNGAYLSLMTIGSSCAEAGIYSLWGI